MATLRLRPPWPPPCSPPCCTPGSSCGLDLKELLLLVGRQPVDLVGEPVGELLEFLLDPLEVVLRELAVALEMLELVLGVAADVADRDTPRLCALLHVPDQLLAPVLRQGGKRQSDHLTVVRRRDPEVGAQDGLLDGAHGIAVVRA